MPSLKQITKNITRRARKVPSGGLVQLFHSPVHFQAAELAERLGHLAVAPLALALRLRDEQEVVPRVLDAAHAVAAVLEVLEHLQAGVVVMSSNAYTLVPPVLPAPPFTVLALGLLAF